MWVGEIDVHDDDLVRRFWEAGKEGDAHGRAYPAYWSLQAATVAFRDLNNPVKQRPIAAMEGAEVLGVNQMIFPRLDNTHLAYVEPIVRPSYRRRGIGTALLQASLDAIRDARRTIVISEVSLPLTGTAPGRLLLEKHGFAMGILDIHRVLDLPMTDAQLDQFATDAAAHHDDYRLVSWVDSVPDDYLDGFCRLQEAFNSEAPMGGLEVEPEVWDAERVRNAEDRFRRQGRHECATVAIAPGGDVVALTEMMTTNAEPDKAWQGGTLVRKEHRGHRLGMAVKVANLRNFQGRFPRAELVHSWNAEENGPMVAINEQLGFRPVEHMAEMQLKL